MTLGSIPKRDAGVGWRQRCSAVARQIAVASGKTVIAVRQRGARAELRKKTLCEQKTKGRIYTWRDRESEKIGEQQQQQQ